MNNHYPKPDFVKTLIDRFGPENVVFLIPGRPVRSVLFLSYTSSNDPTTLLPYKIEDPKQLVNGSNYGYKIRLRCMVPGYSSERFYQSDLSSMVQDPEREHRVFIQGMALGSFLDKVEQGLTSAI